MSGLRYPQRLYDIPNPGDRVRLLYMSDEPRPILPGSEGTVTDSNCVLIHVRWDDGRRLSLVPGVDSWEVL